jgi:hypothetical protein
VIVTRNSSTAFGRRHFGDTLERGSTCLLADTQRLTERVINTFQQLLRCFCCYDGTKWTEMLPQVEFACNATRALGIKHTPLEAIGTTIPVVQNATFDSCFARRVSTAVEIAT